MNTSEGFLFNTPDDLMVFWRSVRMFKLNTEEQRVELLRKLVARKKARYLPHPKEYLKGKNVLRPEL